jgi:protein XagA
MRNLLYAVLLGSTMAPQVHAGAWSQPQGATYAKVSSIFYVADEVYNDMGDRQRMGMDDDEFTGDQVFLYIEHGLRDRLTGIGQVSGGVLTSTNRLVRQRTTGIGDAEVGLKYQLIDAPVVLSPMLSIKIPTGYHDDYDPALGTGSADVEGRILAARSLWPLPLYVGAELGYRWRGGAFSDQLVISSEIGATPHERVFLKGFTSLRDTRSGTRVNLGLVGASQQVSEGDAVQVGLNGAVRLHGGVWLDVLMEWAADGENVGAGTSWGIGISYGG